MNTVDALKKLYKTLAGKDYAGDPNPTDAEMIDAIAKDASGGGSSSGAVRVILLDDRLDTETEKYIGTGQTDPGLTAEELMSAVWILRNNEMGGLLTRMFPRDMMPFETGGNATLNLVVPLYSEGDSISHTHSTATYNSATGEVRRETD